MMPDGNPKKMKHGITPGNHNKVYTSRDLVGFFAHHKSGGCTYLTVALSSSKIGVHLTFAVMAEPPKEAVPEVPCFVSV